MPRVQKMGPSSIGVTIPSEIQKALGLKPGDEIQFRQRGSIIELVPMELRPRLRPEVEAALLDTMEQYDAALERLAR